MKYIVLLAQEIGENAMNAANILKPALASGEIQVIGTTTLREYRKYIEKDSALERRFQTVIVEEPNEDVTADILAGIKKYYEDFHKVKISNEVIRQTVSMSEKYIHDRFLPDKAIDILDEACSRINLDNKELYKLELLKNELKEILSHSEEPLYQLVNPDYLHTLMNNPADLGKPWFGQLMAVPQMYAYLIEINDWMKTYHIRLDLSK